MGKCYLPIALSRELFFYSIALQIIKRNICNKTVGKFFVVALTQFAFGIPPPLIKSENCQRVW